MNVRKELEAIRLRVFNEDFQDMVSRYLVENKDALDLSATEPECRRAIAYIREHFTPTRQEEISEVIRLYQENQRYAQQYSFSCGLYAAIRQFLDPSIGSSAPHNRFTVCSPFSEWVVNGLFTMPGMKRHPRFLQNRNKCLAMEMHVEKSLSPPAREAGSDHIASVGSHWQATEYAAAHFAFYCGYRAGLEVLETVHPLEGVEMIPYILTTEYYLGLTSTYSQRECKTGHNEMR